MPTHSMNQGTLPALPPFNHKESTHAMQSQNMVTLAAALLAGLAFDGNPRR